MGDIWNHAYMDNAVSLFESTFSIRELGIELAKCEYKVTL